jgi:hypothetical protein
MRVCDSALICFPAGREQTRDCDEFFQLTELLVGKPRQVHAPVLYWPAVDGIRLRQHLAERFQALAHFAQRDNRASVVAIGFRPGKQFPSFALNSPHFVEQGFAEALFVLGLGFANRIGDVVFVTE